MDDPLRSKAKEKRAWNEFHARNAKSPFVNLNPLYPLPCELINLIQNEIEEFFNPEEHRFEMDLSATVSSCFFHQRPIGLVVRNQEDDIDRRIELSSASLQKQSREINKELGFDSSYNDKQNKIISKWVQGVNELKKAYIGWLISNSEYIIELSYMMKKWGSKIENDGSFPLLYDITRKNGKFQSSFYRFYCRWGLETLETWLMPIPIDPELELGFPGFREFPSDAGVNIFLPYYMLRRGDLDYRELIRLFRADPVNPYLLEWTRISGKHHTKIGDKRFIAMLDIFSVFFLALRFRYPNKLINNIGHIDKALSEYYECSVDKVSDARQSLQRIYYEISHTATVFFNGEEIRG